MRKIKLLLLSLLLPSVFLSSCGGGYSSKNKFEEWDVSEKGIFTWNPIKEAKYYNVYINDKNDWYETNRVDLTALNSLTYASIKITVQPFVSKTLDGVIQIEALKETVYCVDSNYYLEKDVPSYSITFDYGDYKTSETKSVSKNYVYASYIPSDTIVDDSHQVEGWYYDQAFKNAVDINEYIKSDTTIYAKVVARNYQIKVYSYDSSKTQPSTLEGTINTSGSKAITLNVRPRGVRSDGKVIDVNDSLVVLCRDSEKGITPWTIRDGFTLNSKVLWSLENETDKTKDLYTLTIASKDYESIYITYKRDITVKYYASYSRGLFGEEECIKTFTVSPCFKYTVQTVEGISDGDTFATQRHYDSDNHLATLKEFRAGSDEGEIVGTIDESFELDPNQVTRLYGIYYKNYRVYIGSGEVYSSSVGKIELSAKYNDTVYPDERVTMEPGYTYWIYKVGNYGTEYSLPQDSNDKYYIDLNSISANYGATIYILARN